MIFLINFYLINLIQFSLKTILMNINCTRFNVSLTKKLFNVTKIKSLIIYYDDKNIIQNIINNITSNI